VAEIGDDEADVETEPSGLDALDGAPLPFSDACPFTGIPIFC